MLQTVRFVLLLMFIPVSAFTADEIVTLSTRNGVTIDLLISTPEAPNGTALIMLPGGDGSHHFGLRDGAIKRGNNFLVRTVPNFSKKGFLIAVIGLPSDKPYGMDDDFRASKEHLQDITRVVHFLAGKGYSAIYLVGTSRGTISAAYLGAALKHGSVKGIILTSTMNYTEFLRWLPLEETPYPVLVVHHKDDGCKATSYFEATQLTKRLKKSPKVDFVGLEGGLPPKSGSCNALSPHGFYGIEEDVVDALSTWILDISPMKMKQKS
jgi:hypothetical protein